MKALPWFRMYHEALDDEKLRLLACEDRWHFVALLCCKAKGILDEGGALLKRKVAVKLGLSTSELDEVTRRLSEVGLIDQVSLQPMAWDSRQMQSDSSTDRVQAYRERMKQTGNTMKRYSNVSVTTQETDTDTDKEEDTDKTVGFASFYEVYPKKIAKPNAIKAFKAARLKQGELDAILIDIETRKQSDDWTKENGKYIPMPSTYLNQRRWEDGETAHTSSYASAMAGAI